MIDFADNKINVTQKLKFVLGRVENIVGKQENVGYQVFSPLPIMFSKSFLTLSQTSPGFYVSAVQFKSFENTVGKGEIARNEQFLLFSFSPFPTAFSTCLKNFLPFSSNFELSSANTFSLEESKICRLGKG